ncbi:ligase-associated DNA damage response DEXH box helicase [Hellea balneolensis]|uniref:ligase-associated DNA damage response DEXH box helicase n=1 Tax=Hellea balneolensis TaxID=287478 RepID=UPI0003FE26E6|nr:ligase-associated DNA damage response DEXH box helicase [Hellea balneolensis]
MLDTVSHKKSLDVAEVPKLFETWFTAQGWSVRDYQRQMVQAFTRSEDTLLIAPTGGGKTLAGFLPSLIELSRKEASLKPKLHTLYISPLRALTNDIERNLNRPIAELSLPIRVGVRTGDTKSYQRAKQRKTPPDILLTTPESLMLLLSYPDAETYFSSLQTVIIDELHSFSSNKRGDFTSLALSRLKTLAPDHIRFGLSATIADETSAAKWLGPSGSPANIISVSGDTPPELTIMEGKTRYPLGGHNPRFAVRDIYSVIKKAKSAIIFVNTRAQTELLFQQLWQVNDDNLPIGLYHGSLSRERRQKTEDLIATGKLRAVVSTSALEMGIDWGDIDLILQVGAPKGVSRLLQRIGRSNHRMDEPSEAVLVPCNPLEAVECAVAIKAIQNGKRDGEDYTSGAMDVAVQYIVNRACAGKFKKRELLAEIRQAWPYRNTTKADFDLLVNFARDGGYALQSYDRFARLNATSRGYQISSPQQARRHRMNIGTIVEYAKLKVRRFPNMKSKRGRNIGEIEERFVMGLAPGDSFVFGGEVLRYHGVRDMALEVSPMPKTSPPKVPAYAGGMMPLSTFLAEGVRRTLSDPLQWMALPLQIRAWLELQSEFSKLPSAQGVLVEGFFDKGAHVIVIHSFEGRKVNMALGLLMSRRMEKRGLKPLTYSITDYALTITSMEPVNDVESLMSEDILQEDYQKWVSEAPMVKRGFRKIATIAGLTEQRLPGAKRTMKQVSFSTDLIYDVLQKYDPDHILLRIAKEEAERDLLDMDRLRNWLHDVQGQIDYVTLPHASPLSIPSMMQLGKETLIGDAKIAILEQASHEDMADMRLDTVKAFVDAKNTKI